MIGENNNSTATPSLESQFEVETPEQRDSESMVLIDNEMIAAQKKEKEDQITAQGEAAMLAKLDAKLAQETAQAQQAEVFVQTLKEQAPVTTVPSDSDELTASFDDAECPMPETQDSEKVSNEVPVTQAEVAPQMEHAVQAMLQDKAHTIANDSENSDESVTAYQGAAQVNIEPTDDLVPSFGDDESDKTDEKDEDNNDEDLVALIPDLPRIHHTPNETIFKTFEIAGKQIEMKTTSVLNTATDEAFLAQLTSVQKAIRRKYSAPLMNSGIMAEVIGAGIIDFISIFDVDERTDALQYEISKLEALFRAVIGTTPKVKGSDFSEILHYSDYEALAHAYLCGSQKVVHLPATCSDEKCNTDFIIETNPADLPINLDEISDRINELVQMGTKDSVSSLTKITHEVTDPETGIKVVLKHPSYKKYLKTVKEVKQAGDGINGRQMRALLGILIYIDHIVLPTNFKTTSTYQNFTTLKSFDDTIYDFVYESINEMQKQIKVIKFGVKGVCCPKCGKVINDMTFNGIDELIFFHIMVYKALQKAKSSQK